jgi:hypothetical protein
MPPQAITDMNGNFTYAAYPPQAFQPAHQAMMPHHAWAQQQNAFAYHYGGETDVEMDGQATPPPEQHQRHTKSGTPYSDREGRYGGRDDDDAEGEDDDDEDDDEEYDNHYSTSRLPYPPPSKGLKRSRSYSRMSSPDESAVSDVEWQPKRKMTAKKGSSAGNGPSRKNVGAAAATESRRPTFVAPRKKSGLKKSTMSPVSDVEDGEIRYTTNAEDKQTDRVSWAYPVVIWARC